MQRWFTGTHLTVACLVWISEETGINWSAFITETECVYFALRTESLNIIQVHLVFRWFKLYHHFAVHLLWRDGVIVGLTQLQHRWTVNAGWELRIHKWLLMQGGNYVYTYERPVFVRRCACYIICFFLHVLPSCNIVGLFSVGWELRIHIWLLMQGGNYVYTYDS